VGEPNWRGFTPPPKDMPIKIIGKINIITGRMYQPDNSLGLSSGKIILEFLELGAISEEESISLLIINNQKQEK
jgi:hypothetical protein